MQDKPERTRPVGRTVTSKVLAVLEAFENGGRSQSLAELARTADLPLSTAHRLLGELVDWGALIRDHHGRYQLGIRPWELTLNAGGQLRDTARPFLQELFSLTRETVNLAVREGDEALYLDRIYGSTRVPRAARIGGRLPLHATAVGKILLAFDEDWVRSAYLHHRLESRTRFTHVNPSRLDVELDRVREAGYATAIEEVRLGSCSIAVPVRTKEPHVEAALGLVLLSTDGSTMKRHLPALWGIARKVEAAIQNPLTRLPPVRGHPRRLPPVGSPVDGAR